MCALMTGGGVIATALGLGSCPGQSVSRRVDRRARSSSGEVEQARQDQREMSMEADALRASRVGSATPTSGKAAMYWFIMVHGLRRTIGIAHDQSLSGGGMRSHGPESRRCTACPTAS